MGGILLANHAKVLRPEPHVDRIGRAKGNWIGLACVLKGELDPSKMLDLN
jgi:hypothetical protein